MIPMLSKVLKSRVFPILATFTRIGFRGKSILEQLCCARPFTELENPALFSAATSLGIIERDFQTP